MRVMRQLLAESMVLAFAGAILGLAVARLAVMGLVRLSPNAVPRLPETGIDAWVLAFALGTSVSAALLFGAGPAFSLWRADLREALKDGARGSVGLAGLRMRRVLVAGELALAIVLLAGAGLMLKSYWRMNAHQDGFQPESILMMKIRLAGPQYDESSAQQAYVRELLRRLEGAPGVKAAGISTWFGFSGTPAFPADTSSEQTHTIRENAVSPGFMKAVGMRLVKGRWLTDTDPANFVLLNESMAREAFGTMNPIGGALKIPQPVTVVGVVGDLKYSKLDSRPLAEVYVRHDQLPFFRGTEVAVKTVGDPTAMANDIRKLISEIDPSQPVYDMKTLEQSLAESITPRRFNMFLMGTFAAAALLLAVVGIYGVIAYSVAERTREIGVRMALGAQRRQVIWMVIVEGIGISVAGVSIGLIAALGLTRLMSSLLYDVKPNDPLTFLVVGAVLAGTALLACWGPAIKAALMDPMMALRHE